MEDGLSNDSGRVLKYILDRESQAGVQYKASTQKIISGIKIDTKNYFPDPIYPKPGVAPEIFRQRGWSSLQGGYND